MPDTGWGINSPDLLVRMVSSQSIAIILVLCLWDILTGVPGYLLLLFVHDLKDISCELTNIMYVDGNIHYENTPMQHTAIFHGCKNDNFRLIFCFNIFIFLLKHRLWVHVRTASLRRF